MFIKIVKFILLVCWMMFIFSLSSDNGDISTKKSDGFIIKLVETFSQKKLSESEKEKWTTYLVVHVRKSAHLFIYLILGLLVYSFITEFMINGYKALLLSIGLSFFYACSDEVHQMFVSGRSGQVSDVILDVFGSLLGILVFKFIFERKSKYE